MRASRIAIPLALLLAGGCARFDIYADPEMKKAGAASYTDADYAAFAEVSNRIQATSTKAKDFTKGPDFDKLADQLHEKAAALGKAAGAKDQKASSDALAGMKATCKECHSKFK